MNNVDFTTSNAKVFNGAMLSNGKNPRLDTKKKSQKGLLPSMLTTGMDQNFGGLIFSSPIQVSHFKTKLPFLDARRLEHFSLF